MALEGLLIAAGSFLLGIAKCALETPALLGTLLAQASPADELSHHAPVVPMTALA